MAKGDDDLVLYPDIDLGPEGEDGEEVAPFVVNEGSSNIVSDLLEHPRGKEFLRRASASIRAWIDADYDSSEEHRARLADDWKVFIGDLPPKKPPFEWTANGHVPIMLENLSRLTFRTKAELFGDWSYFFAAAPVGPDDQDVAEILTAHGQWQLTEQIPDFKRQLGDRGILLFYTHGDVTCHSYFDTYRGHNRHEVLSCDEFITPYVYVSTMPDYSDCPRYYRIRFYYRHELEAMRGEWEQVEMVLDRSQPSWEDDPEMKMRQAAAEIQRIEMPDIDPHTPHKVVQWFGFLELPGEDRERFCEVYIHHATGVIFSLHVQEEPSSDERMRYERQLAEQSDYLDAVRQFDATRLERERVQRDDAMLPEEKQSWFMDPMPEEPKAPSWLDPNNPEAKPPPMKMRRIDMFAHGVCIEPIVGSLGYGFGRIQSDFNRGADTILSQFIDAASLANSKGHIISSMVTFEEPFSVAPGKVNRVRGVVGDDLKRNILPLEYGQANPQMLEVADRLYSWAQSSIQAPDVLSGEMGKSGETYRGIAARIDQATKQLSVVTRKYADFVTQVLKNNAQLNALFLPDEEILAVNNHRIPRLNGKNITIGRDLYRKGYNVTIRADLKFIPDAQRIDRAQQTATLVMSHPMLATNLLVQYLAIKKMFEALEQYDMVDALGTAPPPQPFGMPMTPPGPPGQPGAAPPEPNGATGPPPEGPPTQ